MAKPRKKGLVKANSQNRNQKEEERVLKFVDLVKAVKRSRNKQKAEDAFSEIVKMMKVKIEQIAYKFQIPGCNFDDVYQEALYALRYKAIKDYDQTRSNLTDISPFDKFAALCIRRHLSTKLKSAYQNRQKIWTTSVSLDQDRKRASSSNDGLFLSDIVTDTDKDVSEEIDHKQRRNEMLKKLYDKLSEFEKEIFLLYCQRLSYHEIVEKANARRKKDKINTKSVDNALSRIKLKGRRVSKKMGGI